MKVLASQHEFSSNLITEIFDNFDAKLAGIVAFGSNANLEETNINVSKDYDLLVVTFDEYDTLGEKTLDFVTKFLIKYKIRLDIHLYTLPELASGLRRPDLLLVGLGKNYQILYSTLEFNAIFQLIDTINNRHQFRIHI